MVANKSITGSGSFGGPGNIMGSPINGGPTFAHSYAFVPIQDFTFTCYSDQYTDWSFYPCPTEMYGTNWAFGESKTVTISGITGANSALNGTTINISTTNNQDINYPGLFSGAPSTFTSMWIALGLPNNSNTVTQVDFLNFVPGITWNWN